MSSPCAKLTTSMMPKIRVSPDATSARIMPVTTPLIVWIRIWSSGMSISYSEIFVDHRVVDMQLGRQGGMAHLAFFGEIDAPAGFQRQRHVLLDHRPRPPFALRGAAHLATLGDQPLH